MPSTNTPIRVGLVGFGASGRYFHSPYLAADPSYRLEVIATANEERVAQARAEHPDAAIVAGPNDVLDRADDLDLVVLGTPPQTHCDLALSALQAGLAVVVDKPFVPTVVEAKQLIQAADAAGRPLVVFHNRRYDGDFRTVQNLVRSGALGDIHRFESTFERWSGPLRERWQDATTVPQGGGISYDLGSHLVDQALQLFGPAEVEHAEVRGLRDGAVADDDATIWLRHLNGTRTHLTMSRVAGQTGPRFRVLGARGAYSSYGLDRQERQLHSGMRPGEFGFGVVPEEGWGMLGAGASLQRIPTERGDYGLFYAQLARTLLEGAPAPVDVRDALEVVRIIERAHAVSAAVASV